MFNKKGVIIATLAVIGAGLLVFTTAGSKQQGGNKLEGAWIAKSTNNPVQGSYVLAASDPSGRSATISGLLQVRIPIQVLLPGLFGDSEISGDFVGEAVMTGPSSADYTVIGYGRKNLDPPTPFKEQVVLIWVDSGQMTFINSRQVLVTHNVAYYLPNADADGDGLPDPGQVPVICLPATTLDTRVGLIPPCTP